MTILRSLTNDLSPRRQGTSSYRAACLTAGFAALGSALFILGCQRALPTEGLDGPTATQLTWNLGTRAVIGLGSSVRLQATPRDSQGQPVGGYTITWESSNPSILQAAEDGFVTAVAMGSTMITATAEQKGNPGKGKDSAPGQLKKQMEIIVDPVQVASVEVVPSEATVEIGKTIALSAITRDADGNQLADRVIAWSSSPTSVATVDETGTVSGQTVSSATITATSEGQSGTASVTVIESTVVDVAVWPRSANVQPGQRAQFYAAFLFKNGSVVCEPASPSTDPAVLFNASVVDGCAEAKALLDFSKASGALTAP